MNYNKVTLAGRLTRDPELRFTTSGLAIARLGLAINRKWRDKAQTEKEEVTFVEVEAFGKTAERLGADFRKGHPIFVEGRLKTDEWEDKTTRQKRSKLVVVLDSFHYLQPPDRSAAPPASPPAAAAPETEDEVPF